MSRVTTVKLNTNFIQFLLTFHHGKTYASTTFINRTIILRKWTLWKSVYPALRPIYGVHNRPTERTIRHTIGKLENNLTSLDDT